MSRHKDILRTAVMRRINRYVLGFAFTEEATSVLLVRKNRPDWQKGKLNGIGGKIKIRETPIAAINREAFEGAGIKVSWQHKGVIKGTNNAGSEFECHVFYAYEDFEWQQKKDEELIMADALYYWQKGEILQSLNYLIPFGLYNDGSKFLIEY